MKYAIYGAGGFGRELVSAVRDRMDRDRMETGARGDLVFVSDDTAQQGTEIIDGVICVAPSDLDWKDQVFLALESQARRRVGLELSARGIKPSTLFASTARRGPGVRIGEGATICDFVTLTASSQIGDSFQANIYSYVAHDCRIGNFVTLAPRASINGNVIISDDVYIGTGAVIKQGTPDRPIEIGPHAVIGMGAVVTKSVGFGQVVVGNPARPMPRG